MYESESGSGPGSGVSELPITPSVVLATDMGGVSGIATASLAMSVLALLFGMLAVVIMAIFIYFHIRLTNEVRRLRESAGGGGGLAKVENGSSNLVAVNILNSHEPPDLSETEDKDLDRTPTPPPPPSPKRTNPVPQTTTAPPRVTTPAQPVPKSPQEVPEPPAQNAPARVASPRDTYDNVNLLMSVLPPELRTEENLEGRPLGLAEVRQLEEEERRKEQSYEDVEMSLRRKEAAVEGVRWLAASSPEREGSDDLYTNPADAIADEDAVKAAAKKGSLKKKKRKRESRKSESESVSSAEQHVPELYTTVFDHLPVGEREVVAKQQTKIGVSGSPSPHTEKRTLGEGGGGGGVKRDVCGYEDVEDDMIARSAPSKDSPFSGGVAKLDDTYVAKKSELKKRYSHPASSRRDREGAKELVEVNPRSKKPVTLSSGRRKKIQKEEVDGEEGEGPKSPDSSPTAKEFGITDKGGPQDSYAMVDMAGKFRYRAESDSMKREGSGAPKHYTVKEKPPESDSKQVELVVVET